MKADHLADLITDRLLRYYTAQTNLYGTCEDALFKDLNKESLAILKVDFNDKIDQLLSENIIYKTPKSTSIHSAYRLQVSAKVAIQKYGSYSNWKAVDKKANLLKELIAFLKTTWLGHLIGKFFTL